VRRAEHAVEFLDRPVPRADREAALRDIDRLNAWFGGYWLTRRAIERLTGGARSITIIDVGGGRGDFARRLARSARRRGRHVRVVVVDRDAAVTGQDPDVVAVRADATALPFREDAADVATASLLLHHLDPDDAVRGLSEMRAAARRGVVVNDLLRTRVTVALVWLVTRLFTRHRFARHDGPLSVRRAYAPAELRTLAEKAGIARLAIRRHTLLGRLIAIAEGPGA
jgi:ubiquinone/menaquinone biosynthesis C-methylase UbiE